MNFNRVIKNIMYLLFSNVLIRALSALATILVARYLGANDFGLLSIALAFASITGYFTDLGLTHTVMREGTKEHASLNVLMSSFFKMRMLLSLITIAASVALFYILYDDTYFISILCWTVIPTIIGAALQGTGAVYFQIIEKMHYTSIIRSVAGILNSGALILAMFYNWPLEIIAPIYGLSNLIAGFISLLFLHKRVKLFDGFSKAILHGLLSFTISGILIMTIPQLGPIILSKVANINEVGLFSAAYRIPVLLYQIPSIVAAAFYPVLFRLGNQANLSEHLKVNIIEIKAMSIMGAAISFPFLIYSDWWISTLFGQEWLAASTSLQILSLMVLLQSINFSIADGLTTLNKQKYRTITLSISMIIGAFLYLMLGAQYGHVGGAIAAISIESLMFILLSIFYKGIGQLLIKGLLKNMSIFIGVSALFYYFSNYIHPLVGSILGSSLIILVIFLIDRQLKQQFVKIVKNKFFKNTNDNTINEG